MDRGGWEGGGRAGEQALEVLYSEYASPGRRHRAPNAAARETPPRVEGRHVHDAQWPQSRVFQLLEAPCLP